MQLVIESIDMQDSIMTRPIREVEGLVQFSLNTKQLILNDNSIIDTVGFPFTFIDADNMMIFPTAMITTDGILKIFTNNFNLLG